MELEMLMGDYSINGIAVINLKIILLFIIFIKKYMSLIIYHKNLKVLIVNKFDKKYKIKFYENIAKRLIIDGFKQNRKIPEQIKIYSSYVKTIQNKKMYKLREEDKDYYVMCVLGLWQLGVYDPDDSDSPIYIAPPKKKRKKRI